MPKVETVEFNGRKYRRYPESQNPTHRKYFGRAGARLHRDVWIYHNGSIPDGHHIHHIDGDTGNNDISNLECIPASDHRAEHKDELLHRNKSERQLRHLNDIRVKATEWHKSDEGREWHKQHVMESLAKAWGKPRDYPEIKMQCHWCGGEMVGKTARRRFCKSACQTAESKFRLGKSSYEHPYHAARVRSDSRE